jgi:hypothetical protein
MSTSTVLVLPTTGASTSLPFIFTAQPQAKKRLRDFFSSHIRNKNTRRAYMEAVRQFSAFCAQYGDQGKPGATPH